MKELPEPLNNIYFDTIVAVIIAAYLLYRIIDMLHSFFYYRHIRKMAERERKEKKEQEARMYKREQQVYEEICKIEFGKGEDANEGSDT